MKLKISNQCVCFYPIKIGIKKGHMKKKKKELIQHNVTYKKLKIKKRERENVVVNYKELWYIYIYIY